MIPELILAKDIINRITDPLIKQRINTELNADNIKLIEKFLYSSFNMRFTFQKYPELLLSFTENRRSHYKDYKKHLYSEYQGVITSDKFNDMYSGLRRIKKIEIAKLCIDDFLGKINVFQTSSLLSDLADFLIEQSVQATLLNPEIDRLITCDYLKENLFIIGMGKHGGRELNVSSDIDLIFFARDEILEDHIKSEVLYTFVKSFLDFLRMPSENGFIYRVDLRLRPDGSDGPIISGVKNSIRYYKERGHNWEYQAFIKARYIWGSRKLYDSFHPTMYKIIFNAGNSENILVEMRDIKDRIEKKISLKTRTVNFKLGPGGIRDIEFIIQFLQLVHGFRYTEIREQNSILALKKLMVLNIISPAEYHTLKNNYILLRKIENILQFESDLPRQELPVEDEKLERIFNVWDIQGFHGRDDYAAGFRTYILKRMAEVRNIYRYIFNETIRYLELKKKILTGCSGALQNIAEDHFLRMDSEYFLRFNESDILLHLSMIEKLSPSNLCEIKIEEKDGIYKICIVAFDYNYEFSKIAGLITANGMDIISGESYTYSEYEAESSRQNDNNFFYRRKRKRIYTGPGSSSTDLLYKRKIVCNIGTKSFDSSRTSIDRDAFKNDLNEILKLLELNQAKEAENLLNTKIFNSLANILKVSHTGVSPIEIEVDNEGSDNYTILSIKSKNSFAFLYSFTRILASRNYYIYKVEINTINNSVHDRLFIMTRDGNKITEKDKIDELKITVTMIKQYFSLCMNSVNPNNALSYFENLLTRIFDSKDMYELPILGQKDVQEKLSTLFGISDFIWEDIFRIHYSALLPLLKKKKIDSARDQNKIRETFHNKYIKKREINNTGFDVFIGMLNEFKDREMFRIDLRQILKKTNFFTFANELTNLAEVIIDIALKKIEHDLLPCYPFRQKPPWAVFGLGKLGGMELGFASDIELLFIYDLPEKQTGDPLIQDYFEKMIQTLLKTIIAKREGIFKIDLNLRPYGRKGDLATPIQVFKKYFSDTGEALFFEKQALTKLRFMTSNKNGFYLKSEIEKARDNFVYSGKPPDIPALLKIRKMQIDNYIKNRSLFNAKFSPGGLVEIEYIVQMHQIKYGHLNPGIRKTSTLDVLDELYKTGIMDDKTFEDLRESYIFFRNLINILRMEKGNSKDLTVYSEDSLEFEYLVRRSYFIEIINTRSPSAFIEKLNRHRDIVQSHFLSLGNL